MKKFKSYAIRAPLIYSKKKNKEIYGKSAKVSFVQHIINQLLIYTSAPTIYPINPWPIVTPLNPLTGTSQPCHLTGYSC